MNVGPTCVQGFDFRGIYIESDDRYARPGELERERKTHVSETDNGDALHDWGGRR
jgi:hypothetical protein